MRITIAWATTPDVPVLTLVDGPGWLNSWPIRGEVFGLEKDGLDGWYDGVDPEIGDMPSRPGVDGAFWPEQSVLLGRSLTIRGFHSVRGLPWNRDEGSSVGVARARDLLASLAGVSLHIVVEDSGGVREVTGYVAVKPMVRRVDEWRTKFSIIVTCPDPLKYGAAVNYSAGSGVVEVENVGTGDVPFVLSSTSRIRSLEVLAAGRRLEWAGDSVGLALDTSDGRPLSPAGAETGYLIYADALRVPPGVHPVQVVADAPVTLTIRPGWK